MGYLKHDKRLHAKEMRRIANAYIAKREKKTTRREAIACAVIRKRSKYEIPAGQAAHEKSRNV